MELTTPATIALPGFQPARVDGAAPPRAALPARSTTLATHPPAARRRGRRRYWSIRDISRRLWYGRGYELLRELIRTGILPSSRSARSRWLGDADVAGLIAAFDAGAGKVRAFRGLDRWLRERCYAAPLTPDVEAALSGTQAALRWRGAAYLPKAAWDASTSSDGLVVYRHRSGVTLPTTRLVAA